MKVAHYMWDGIAMFCKEIAEDIPEGKYEYLYGVPRGGMIPAVILSHILEIPVITKLDLIKCHKVLVVDDIIDSGGTISRYKDYDTAAIFWKKEIASESPTYYARLVDPSTWIQFPWEKRTNDPVSDVNLLEEAI
jgi:hypothetical protein